MIRVERGLDSYSHFFSGQWSAVSSLYCQFTIHYNMNHLLFLGTWEIILIVLVILLLFGARRIPELMRGLGKGVKSFKDGMNGVDENALPVTMEVDYIRVFQKK